LKDVPIDIEIASSNKAQLLGSFSERRRQVHMIAAFGKRAVDETGKLCAKVFISKKIGILPRIYDFFSLIKSWLTIGKRLADLFDANQIKINLEFLVGDKSENNLDAALGLWRKTQQFVEFGIKESDEIADLVKKGLLSGPKAEAKIEELLSNIDISDTPVLKKDFIQDTDIENLPLGNLIGNEDSLGTDTIERGHEEFILDLTQEEYLEENIDIQELDKDIIEEDEEKYKEMEEELKGR